MQELYQPNLSPARQPGRTLETSRLGETWLQTEPIPCVGRAGTIALMNMLVREGRGRWITNVPCVKGFQVSHFDFMEDRQWISIDVFDCILKETIQIVVPWYTVFGFALQKEEWR